MAKRAEERKPRLKVVPPKYMAQAPVLTLADAIQLYYTLHEEAKLLGDQIEHIRKQMLSTLEELGVDEIHFDGFEVIRQIRRYTPPINMKQAEKLLKRFGRLDEAKVERIDEDKVRVIVDDLLDQGLISERDLPYEAAPETEVLIVRKAEEQAPAKRKAAS